MKDIKKTSTSNKVKNKYNYSTYLRKVVSIRKGSDLEKAVVNYEGSFSGLVNTLLAEYFEVDSGIGENPYLK